MGFLTIAITFEVLELALVAYAVFPDPSSESSGLTFKKLPLEDIASLSATIY